MACSRALPSSLRRAMKPVATRSPPPPKQCVASTDLTRIERGWVSRLPRSISRSLGEVLYGNVGAMDRLDFTVIGPAVNEVARIETLCEPLGHSVLVSAELASAAGNRLQLEPLGAHLLRGVREPKEIFALRL
jgi:adenylate cyclase